MAPIKRTTTISKSRHRVRDEFATGAMRTEANHIDLLSQLRDGRRESLDEITAILYDELQEIAHRHRATRDDAATLATTALVHEAYLKLVDQSSARWNDR